MALTYPYTYRWSAEGQKALDRLIDGMMIAALPLDVTVPGLADALRQGGAFERARAARTLARFGPLAADAVPALVRALDDPSRIVRSAAIAALGRIGPKAKAAVPALAGIRDVQLRPLADGAVKEIDPR
jgi:HEAT repeat protein